MQVIATVLACLACAGHSRRVQVASRQKQASLHASDQNSVMQGDTSPTSESLLAAALALSNPAAGWPFDDAEAKSVQHDSGSATGDSHSVLPLEGLRHNPLYAFSLPFFGSKESSEAEESDGASVSDSPKLKPFQRGRPAIVVDKTIEKTLAKGEVWSSTVISGNSAVGQAVMDVDAPPEVVWNQLSDFASYPKKVPMLSACEVYNRKKEGKTERILVKFVSPVVPGVKLTYHVDHTYEPAKSSITWTLDEDKKNDFDEVQGHWHVEPHPKEPAKSRVFYEVGLVAPPVLPKFVIDKLAQRAINDATSWVRRESELEASSKAKESNGAEESDSPKLKPFERGRPSIVMDKAIESALAKGEVWSSTVISGNSAVGQAVMDVDATPEVIWNQLSDFASYPKKVPMLSACEVYKRKQEGKTERILVKFVSPVVPGVKLTYHVDHTYEPEKNSITWTLDDDKKNDFEEVQGHWHVEPHPKEPSKSRVFYEVGLVAPPVLPKFVVNKLAQRAINDATSWVRRESELEASSTSKSEKKLAPFEPGRPLIDIDKTVEKTLEKGKMWKSTEVDGSIATGLAVMDVNAPPNMIWDNVFDWAAYPKNSPMLKSCEVYNTINEGKVEHIFVKFVSPIAPGIKITLHVNHTYDPAKNSLTWTLDTEKESDFEEIEGHWHIEPHPDSPSKSRIFYQIAIVAPSWLPKWAMSQLSEGSINDAIEWIVKESEKQAAGIANPASTDLETGAWFKSLLPWIYATTTVVFVGIIAFS